MDDLGYCPSESEVYLKIQECFTVLEHYDWIVNGLVLDYFNESFWSRLPLSWQSFLSNITPAQLGSWLSTSDSCVNTLFPLSLLSLKAVISKLSLRRIPFREEKLNPGSLKSQSRDSLLSIRVNPKKEHELEKFSFLIQHLAQKTSSSSVFDFGSGIGHLSRRLFFIHGLKTIGLECQEALSQQARKMDEKYARKRKLNLNNLPVHSVATISDDFNGENLFEHHPHHGFVGLHACGDLSSRIISIFGESSSSSFLCLATCCYMKGSLNLMSSSLRHRLLSYNARELGCHALETYVEKLLSHDVNSLLKVHCYRAILERILVKRGPQYRHNCLKSVPKAHSLSFSDYALSATSNLEGIVLSSKELEEAEINLEEEWWRVAVYYVIRLSLAPLIETLIFLDRYLYLKEKCVSTAIVPLFDPLISPRNLVIVAMK